MAEAPLTAIVSAVTEQPEAAMKALGDTAADTEAKSSSLGAVMAAVPSPPTWPRSEYVSSPPGGTQRPGWNALIQGIELAG